MYFPGAVKTVEASLVGVPSPTFFETRSKAQFVADALPSAALHTRATSARATERVSLVFKRTVALEAERRAVEREDGAEVG